MRKSEKLIVLILVIFVVAHICIMYKWHWESLEKACQEETSATITYQSEIVKELGE